MKRFWLVYKMRRKARQTGSVPPTWKAQFPSDPAFYERHPDLAIFKR